MKKWIYLLGLILLIGVFLILFRNPANREFINEANTVPNIGKLKVTASFYPLYYFAKEIGREKAEVKNITPSGIEQHEYEPTPQDIAQIQKSKIVIVNGAGLETWYEKGKGSYLKNWGLVNASGGIEIVDKDPHVWLSPVLAKQQADSILAMYTQVDKTNKGYYQSNAEKLRARFDELDEKFKNGLKSCQKKEFITSHKAFGYLARQYGLNQISIAGISPDEEPSAKQLAEVAEFAKENNVKYIFFESLVSPKLSETIANEIGANSLVLDPLEGISDDNIKQGKNYFTVMEDNLKNLQVALQCN